MLGDSCGSGTSGPNLPWSNGQLELGLLCGASMDSPCLDWVPPKAESEIRTQGVTPESRREGREGGTGKRKAGIWVPSGGLASSWDCEGQKAYWMVHWKEWGRLSHQHVFPSPTLVKGWLWVCLCLHFWAQLECVDSSEAARGKTVLEVGHCLLVGLPTVVTADIWWDGTPKHLSAQLPTSSSGPPLGVPPTRHCTTVAAQPTCIRCSNTEPHASPLLLSL